MKPQLMSLLMVGITLLAVPAGAADETINCTATPDCTSLGYTQSADSCPDGGIKCPFDEDRMFCLRRADLGFQIKNDVKKGDILYTDGTSSSSFVPGKGAIGIVLRAHPGNPRHALVVTNPNVYWYVNGGGYNLPNRLLAQCANGFGKGIYGTGQYLAGVGEVIDIGNVSLRTLFYNYHDTYDGNIITGTQPSQDTYYYIGGDENYYDYLDTITNRSYMYSEYGYCVIYL